MRFWVPGVPIPKGSTRAFIPKGRKRPIVTATNKKTKPWQQAIARVANLAMMNLGREGPSEGPVAVTMWFYLPRPASVKSGQHIKKPDLDKLVRCVLDALTMAHVYVDDSQVVRLTAEKLYAVPGGADCGVEIQCDSA